jgi:DNA mismatch repair protein MutS
MPSWMNYAHLYLREGILEGIEKESHNWRHFFFENFFNNVFGYYIEVRNLHKGSCGVDWKQTLVNAERYITEELKDMKLRF